MSSIDMTLRPILASHARIKIDSHSGDPILLFPEGLLILNSTAYEIARRCTGEVTVGEMLRLLAEEFEAEEEIVRNDLFEHLEQLQRKNLLLFLA